MLIKIAEVSDVEEILSLKDWRIKSETEIYGDFTIPPLVQTLDEVRDEFENHVFLKMVINKRMIGSVRALQTYDETTI